MSTKIFVGGSASPDSPSINVAFTTAAGDRLTEATKIHLGRPIAILLDGKVIAAPTLRSTIRGGAVISGDFTRAEAERIASGLRPSAGAAGPAPAQRYKGDDPGVVLPRVLTEVKPRYTPAAMQAKIQGDVELTAVVREDGSVGDVTVVQSLDTVHGLDDAAVEAVRQWIFAPGTKGGQAVEVEIRMHMRFTLG